LLRWAGIWSSTFSKWKQCYGKEFEHNGWIPRDHWLEPWERDAIISFYHANPLNGYRRLTYMMLDANVVAVSAGTVYNVLSKAGLLKRCNQKSSKGTGFVQPDAPHRHWHTDIAYLNIAGTFYFIASVLDGYSRSVIHWEIREKMEESDIEIILQAAKEKFPNVQPRIITDNGPQFIAKDFKEFIRISGMTHVKTSPYYPQSNGKIERFHRSLKSEGIRPGTPLSIDDAKRVVTKFVKEYNTVRLHSALGYITPLDKLEGREQEIFAERDRKLMEARQKRAVARLQSRKKIAAEKNTKQESVSYSTDVSSEDRALLGSTLSAGLMLDVSSAVGHEPTASAAYV
jgi:transposase InsO family protein